MTRQRKLYKLLFTQYYPLNRFNTFTNIVSYDTRVPALHFYLYYNI